MFTILKNSIQWMLGMMVMVAVMTTSTNAQITLTLLHNNDAESQLVSASGQPDFGGAARFKALVDQERAAAAGNGDAVVVVTSGDNFIPSKEFNASLALPTTADLYDAELIAAVGYDALCLGNHDFDFGPSVLARLVEDVNGLSGSTVPFLSANLDFSGEPALAALEALGQLAPFTIVNKNGTDIGIIGLTTPNLGSISTPGNVLVGQNVAVTAQNTINALQSQGVNIIILISHLQGIAEDQALIGQLSGVDIVVAGGGDELLFSGSPLLVPGDGPAAGGPYPTNVTDLNGNTVPVVTTAGELKYLGRLRASFDAAGNLTSVDGSSNPVRVSGVAPDAVTADASVQTNVVDPVAAFVAGLNSNVIATTQVDLDGIRNTVRGQESNLGNLIADAWLSEANRLAPSFGLGAVDIAMANGGGIRNNNIIPVGDLTEGLTFDILPFANILTVLENVSPAEVKNLLENAYSRFDDLTQSGTGRFAQIAGIIVEIDEAGTEMQIDNNNNIINQGNRVLNATLADGTPYIVNGSIAPGAPNLNIALPDFLARRGDQYPVGNNTSFTLLGITPQQALANFLVNDLGGVVTAADYPFGGEGRITIVNTDVVLSIEPDTTVVGLNQTFTVNVELQAGKSVDGFFADLSFDETVLQVVSLTDQASAEFPTSLIPPTFNNANGTIRFARGTFSNFPKDSLRLLSIEFQAIAPTTADPFILTGSSIDFVGFTDVTFNGNSVLDTSISGVAVVRDLANLTLNYQLQGRLNGTPENAGNENGNFFTVELYEPGTSNLLFSFPGLTGTANGELQISNVFAQQFDVWVKHTKYLARLIRVDLSGGSNTASVGELRAGDANNDNLVNLVDFSILASTFGQAQGSIGYNENADFNGDLSVVLVDFSLLVTNFNTLGAVPGGALSARPAPQGSLTGSTDLVWAFGQEVAKVGEFVTATLTVDALTQSIDGAEAHLTFNTDLLEVVSIDMGSTLNIELMKSFDNEAGTIDLAAGHLTQLASGEVEVATITFRTKAEGIADVRFADRGHLAQSVTFGGVSVLDATVGGELTISNKTTAIDNEIAGHSLNVFPVPSNGEITVEVISENLSNMEIRIYNMIGQVVYRNEVTGSVKQYVDLSQQAAGTYRVQLISGNEVLNQNFSIK
ncbi:MAG: 5'-nucleotidase C-terminal domain-containing protein [Bacteroidota bacterium]